MNSKKILSVLICILALSCVVLTVCLVALNREVNYLPSESIDDIVEILSEENIMIDRNIISSKREHGTVYVCNSGNYSQTVATFLGEDSVHSVYVIPDGEIVILNNGAKFEFGENYSFKYYRSGEDSGYTPSLSTLSQTADHVSGEKREEIAEIAKEFIERGSREFETKSKVRIETVVDNIWENSGIYYALCTRKISGAELNQNLVLCTIDNGEVTEAYGTWCFLTLGDSYSAQLTDILNILFSVKKDISAMRDGNDIDSSPVSIKSVSLSYSLYFYGSREEFCLIPCWQVVTDNMGDFIYNAIDSTLYTNK
ncbi:MAG: hypothetical protein E7672_01775 [Ruminococcaceae bacterium]|nr:hypothetical protein [Oscillospiraceae bacterium]